MTTTFVSDARNILFEADGTDSWTNNNSPSSGTSEPDPVEATGWEGMDVSNRTDYAYTTITSDDYSGGGTLSIWMRPGGVMDTQTNGGVQIVVGDGTNVIGYHVGGSDKSGFRHEDGLIEWTCFVLDLANKPANNTAIAGSEASLNEAAITQVGVQFKTLAKAVGGATNCFWDICRFADNGDAIVFVGGTTSGAAGDMSEAAAIDRSTGNQQAYGVVRELGAGVYGIQGNITLGNSASSSDQYWSETNVTYAWEDRGLSSNNYYRFALIGSSTATNCEFSFTSTTFSVPSAASASFDGNGADITVCDMLGCSFIGFDQGIETSDDTGDSWTNCTFIGNDQIVANGCDLTGSSVSGYEGTVGTGALTYNLAVDPDGELDNMSFTKGTAATHAIEFGASIPSEITLRGIDFSGYNASDTNNDSTLYFLDTTGTITVNLIDCTGNISYRSAGATIDLVIAPVTTKITAEDQSGTLLENVRVLLETADNGGGSGFPYQAATTSLSASSTTATLTASAAHGLSTNDYVVVRGALDQRFNKVAQITVTSTTVFTYTVTAAGGTGEYFNANYWNANYWNSNYWLATGGSGGAAGGTPVFSYAPISGLTDSNGVIQSTKSWPASQGLSGWARKSTTSPYYKTSPISVADASNGTDLLVLMISDE